MNFEFWCRIMFATKPPCYTCVTCAPECSTNTIVSISSSVQVNLNTILSYRFIINLVLLALMMCSRFFISIASLVSCLFLKSFIDHYLLSWDSVMFFFIVMHKYLGLNVFFIHVIYFFFILLSINFFYLVTCHF